MLKLLATLSRATVSAVLCCFCLLAAFAPRVLALAVAGWRWRDAIISWLNR